MKRYAIPPNGCELYLTAGKKYEVLNETNTSFYVITNSGLEAYCLKRKCIHAGGDWTFVDEPDAPLMQVTSQDYRVTGPSSDGVVCLEFEGGANMVWLTKADVEGLLARFEKEGGK